MFILGSYIVCENVKFKDECMIIENKPYQILDIFEDGKNTQYKIEDEEFFECYVKENRDPTTGGNWVLYDETKHSIVPSESFDDESVGDESFDQPVKRGINIS